MRNRTSAILLALLFALAGVASAQETTGTLSGKLTDTQGLAVPGATVTVTGPQGAKTFVTDADGRFNAPFLTPGIYGVRAELQGFKATDIKALTVQLGQTTDVSIKMEVGGLTETVEVTAPPSSSTTPRRRPGRCSRATCSPRCRSAAVSATRSTSRPASAAPARPAAPTRRSPAARVSTTSTSSTAST